MSKRMMMIDPELGLYTKHVEMCNSVPINLFWSIDRHPHADKSAINKRLSNIYNSYLRRSIKAFAGSVGLPEAA